VSWIKVRNELRTHPKIRQVMARLNAKALSLSAVTGESRTTVTRSHVIGCLVVLWMLADEHADSHGIVEGGEDFVDELVEFPGMAAELETIGWVRFITDDFGVQLTQFVNYQEHNGSTAKTRSQNNKRKRKQRDRSVTHERDMVSRMSADRVEEKRGDKNRAIFARQHLDYQQSEGTPLVDRPEPIELTDILKRSDFRKFIDLHPSPYTKPGPAARAWARAVGQAGIGWLLRAAKAESEAAGEADRKPAAHKWLADQSWLLHTRGEVCDPMLESASSRVQRATNLLRRWVIRSEPSGTLRCSEPDQAFRHEPEAVRCMLENLELISDDETKKFLLDTFGELCKDRFPEANTNLDSE